MKIAIPTDDGIHIADLDAPVNGFHVFTVESGEIIDEELRLSGPPHSPVAGDTLLQTVGDCSLFLLKQIPPDIAKTLQDRDFISVNDSLITRVIWNFLAETRRVESNTCCCP
jgi:hypothetical protein